MAATKLCVPMCSQAPPFVALTTVTATTTKTVTSVVVRYRTQPALDIVAVAAWYSFY